MDVWINLALFSFIKQVMLFTYFFWYTSLPGQAYKDQAKYIMTSLCTSCLSWFFRWMPKFISNVHQQMYTGSISLIQWSQVGSLWKNSLMFVSTSSAPQSVRFGGLGKPRARRELQWLCTVLTSAAAPPYPLGKLNAQSRHIFNKQTL